MARLGKTLRNLRHFARHLRSFHQTEDFGGAQRAGSLLREVKNFGSNPGNLRMLTYAPARLAPRPALVVALHGCAQNAASYDAGTGWSTLADRFGFVVVYPEQHAANNPKSCFSWFRPGDIGRDQGEALSIRQMVERAVSDHGIDRSRVFVTGLSAGGAMASVMLATYPEVFAGGAIIAGLPYGCATNLEQAFAAMHEHRPTVARALGDRVRAASSHKGPWPKVSVWHGSADPIVRPSNGEAIVSQWLDIHGAAIRPAREEVLRGYRRRAWDNTSGETVVEAITVPGMGHGVPIASGSGAENCGEVGPFSLEVGVSSTYCIAAFWGLAEARPEPVRAVGPGIVASPVPLGTHALAGATIEMSEREHHRDPAGVLDPNAVIAAAFAAAGLPVPQTADSRRKPPYAVAPQPIIDAALEAAGLVKR